MGIYVVGMHRSGTSVLTRTVGLLVGYEGYRGVGADNVEGHWELPQMNRVLDRALEALRCDWASPPLEPLSRTDQRIQGPVADLDKLVERLGQADWVLKDPRLCLALELILGSPQPAGPVIIATYRHPVEVGQSLAAREGYSREYGIALWEVYCHLMTRQIQSAGLPTLWVSYDDLMDGGEATLTKLADFLTAHGRSVEPDAVKRASSAINQKLRNQREAPDTDVLLPSQAILLDQFQRAVATGTFPNEPLAKISPWAKALLETRRPFIRMEQDNRLLTHRLARFRRLYRAYDKWRRLTRQPVPADPFENYV